MRRMTRLFGTIGALAMGTIATVVACGDDDTSGIVPNAPDAAGETGATTSSSGGSSGASGTSSSSGGPTDGGTSSSSGELPSNPAQYTCGSVTCDAGFTGGGPNVCCEAVVEANTKCTSRNACDNTGANGNLRLSCDESADCVGTGGPGSPPPGAICCYVKEQVPGPGGGQPSFSAACTSRSECRTFQPGQGAEARPQLCKTSAECGDAGACNPKTCDGFKLHVCGAPAGCQ